MSSVVGLTNLGNTCIVKGTPIYLSNGLSTPIDKCIVNQNIQTCQSKELTLTGNISNVLNQGIKECIEVEFIDSTSIKCTEDHKIYTLKKGSKQPGWELASNLQYGDKVMTSAMNCVNTNDYDSNYCFMDWDMRNRIDREKFMAFSRLCGYLNTDGHLHSKANAQLFFGDKLDAEAALYDMGVILGYEPYMKITKVDSGRGVTYKLQSPTVLSNLFRQAGCTIGKKTTQVQSLPTFMFDKECPLYIKREFVAGWWGGDGAAPCLTSSDKLLCKMKGTVTIRVDGDYLKNKSHTLKNMTSLVDTFNELGINSKLFIRYYCRSNKDNISVKRKYDFESKKPMLTWNEMVLDSLKNTGKTTIQIIEHISSKFGENSLAYANRAINTLSKYNAISIKEDIITITDKGMNMCYIDDHSESISVYMECGPVINVFQDLINFSDKIGVRYCLDKNRKLTCAARYLKYRNYLGILRFKCLTYAIKLYLDNNDYNLQQSFCISISKFSIEYPFAKDVFLTDKDYTVRFRNNRIPDLSNINNAKWMKKAKGLMTFKQFTDYCHFDYNKGSRNGKRHMWLTVEKHKSIGPKEVFDLSIPKTHNFVANGFVVHNCYLNSALQCLFHIPELEAYFLKPIVVDGKKYPSAYVYQHKYFSRKRSNVLVEFGNQFQKLLSAVNDTRDNRPIRPMSFRRILSAFKPVFRTAQQQDAHECMILILDKLHESLKMKVSINISGDAHNQLEERKKYAFNQYKSYLANTGYSEMNKLFYGQFESTVICKQCSTPSFNYDPYSSLEIEIPNTGGTLYDCLDDYCFKELLSGEEQYHCEKCNTKVDANKELKIWTLPKVLIIQLKRFNTRLRKNNRHISCPMKLNMTKYVTHPAARDENGNIGLQLYDLVGVVEHSGTLTGGHYTAKCKVDGGVGWKYFNDASVSTIQEKDVITTNAYILVYKMDGHSEGLWNKH